MYIWLQPPSPPPYQPGTKMHDTGAVGDFSFIIANNITLVVLSFRSYGQPISWCTAVPLSWWIKLPPTCSQTKLERFLAYYSIIKTLSRTHQMRRTLKTFTTHHSPLDEKRSIALYCVCVCAYHVRSFALARLLVCWRRPGRSVCMHQIRMMGCVRLPLVNQQSWIHFDMGFNI